MTAGKPAKLDLLDGQFYVDDPYRAYAWYRQHEPVAWDSVNELWGVFAYDLVLEVEKNKGIFTSADTAKGGYRPNMPADPSIIGLDDPLHGQRRNLISRRFTPRAVAAREAHIREIASELIEAALAKGQAEIVSEIAAVLPAKMIGWLLGFPDDLWPKLAEWSEQTILLGGGPRYLTEEGMVASMEFAGAAVELYEEKKRCPADDVMSVWTTATIGGRALTLDEVGYDSILVLDGGAETTRTVLARTLLNLIAHPEQWELLRQGADLAVAVEEFIRYVTPVHNMCRVATRDYRLGDVTIGRGQQVVLMYGSANRDPAQFDDPERFDVTRSPNNHLAFGFGTHFCLGAALARLEIRIFFEEFLARVESFGLVESAPVVEMPNAFVFGLREATVAFQRR